VRDLNIPTTPQDPDANVIGRYFYDGSGARVKKVTATETTVVVYDAGGALAAEYSTETPPAEPTTSYLTTDHLGSPRIITDSSGQVISRRDFMPFGEELGAGVGARTESLRYSTLGSDHIRKRFTGYEKDDETDLDFAEAQMYQNKHGRFTAPDPLLASASAANPQTFNRAR
jgi:RHS repeat-associated protein